MIIISGMPPRSRVQSRSHSRAASPTLSVRSRRSMMSSRQRNKYMHQDLTDDEDSDLDNFTDDSRSRMRRHDSGRTKPKKYAESFDFESDVRHNRIQKMKDKSKYIRERRSGSLTNWPTNNRDSGSMSPVSDEEIRKTSSKFRKASLSTAVPYSSKKITSDSASEKEIAHKRISSPPVSNNSGDSRHHDVEKVKKSQTSSKPVRPVKSPSVSEEEEEEEEEEKEEVIPAPVVIKKQQEAPKSIMSDKSSDRESIQRDNHKPGRSSVPEKPITNGHRETPAVKKPVQRVSTETQSEPPVVKKVKEIPKKIEVPEVVKEPVKIKQQQPTTSKAVPVKEPTIDKQVPSTSKAAAAVTKVTKPQITKPIIEDWECEHCTYVNEALAPICAVCCKTPAVRLQQLPPSDDEADVDLSNVNDTNENDLDAKQKGKNKKISFLPGTKAH